MSSKHAILLIATREYLSYLSELVQGIHDYWPKASTNPPQIIVCTDHSASSIGHLHYLGVEHFPIPHEPWPLVTLHRYATLLKASGLLRRSVTHLYHMDVDMRIVAPLLPEDLEHPLVSVAHPGYWRSPNPYGTPENRPGYAFAHIIPTLYIAGGFQGGSVTCYLRAATTLARLIEREEQEGRIPLWHDESAWNWYWATGQARRLVEARHPREDTSYRPVRLDPSYCYSQQHPHPELIPRIVTIDGAKPR